MSLLPIATQKGIGIINASPFASGLLTDRGPAEWHPANATEREMFAQAALICKEYGTSISKLALQFSCQHPDVPTTMFSSANPESVLKNIQWSQEKLDTDLLEKVLHVIEPVKNKQWDY